MSQTKVWAASKGNTVRNPNNSSTGNAGSGNNQRFFIGRYGIYDYDSFAQFALDWTDVGTIVSAILTVYTDDGLSGIMPATTTESPQCYVKRLTSAFSEGVGPSSSFQTNDWTNPASTTSGQKHPAINRASNGVTNIDITDFVELWAPSSVKKRNGAPGSAYTQHGIGFFGDTSTAHNIALWSEDASDGAMRPYITLTYEYGVTVPDMPTNLTPSGAVDSLPDFEGDFSDRRTTDTLAYSEVEVYTANKSGTGDGPTSNIYSTAHGMKAGDLIYFTSLTGGTGLTALTQAYYVRAPSANAFTVSLTLGGTYVDIGTSYTALTFATRLYAQKKAATQTEKDADHFIHSAALHLRANTNYQWRARVWDNEGQASAWSQGITFSITNNAPTEPVLKPVSGGSYATLDGVQFGASSYNDDDGDDMLSYQVQMSAYPQGDARWDDGQYILWDTGRVYIAPQWPDEWHTKYGGSPLTAGTYYWRARVWDIKDGVSAWSYATITVTASYAPEPDGTQTSIQLRPRAPWRIVIKGMGALRGPGTTVAVIEDAKNVGASILYNSPGELHFTLPKGHPQISVIEPKQTHYSVQFRQGDGWREIYAGLMWDFDASDTDVVFYGIDYLALLDYTLDERYDQSNPDKPSEKGGSKYVTAGKNTIAYIVTDQLTRAKNLANSPVGFITLGSIATMTETLTVFSTYAPTLSFVTGLLDSHRAGQGKKTRLQVRQKTGGGYEFVVQDDPGNTRDNLRMRYGELVQGYRVIPFGTDWASRVSAIGRAKDGIQVLYKTATAPGIDEATWGHFAQVRLIDGVSDANDLQRRTNQAALHAGKLGKSIALGLRSGILQPRDGYDICDAFPVSIEDGSVSTAAFGSGYWIAMGITWECAAQNGKQTTTLTLQPREDGTPPSSDLLTLQPISPQAEWQIGWTSPNPLTATSKYWLDQTTGIVYVRTDGILVVDGTLTGTA